MRNSNRINGEGQFLKAGTDVVRPFYFQQAVSSSKHASCCIENGWNSHLDTCPSGPKDSFRSRRAVSKAKLTRCDGTVASSRTLPTGAGIFYKSSVKFSGSLLRFAGERENLLQHPGKVFLVLRKLTNPAENFLLSFMNVPRSSGNVLPLPGKSSRPWMNMDQLKKKQKSINQLNSPQLPVLPAGA